jgi:hypothetical protein
VNVGDSSSPVCPKTEKWPISPCEPRGYWLRLLVKASRVSAGLVEASLLPFAANLVASTAATRLMRRGRVACAALLASLLLAPSVARAECGDYVVMGGTAARISSAPHQPPMTPGDHRLPCSGPNCSRHIPPAAPAPVAPSTPSSEHWGCAVQLESVPVPAAQHCAVPDNNGLKPVTFTVPVYHPPRITVAHS